MHRIDTPSPMIDHKFTDGSPARLTTYFLQTYPGGNES